jgi:Peptidase family M28
MVRCAQSVVRSRIDMRCVRFAVSFAILVVLTAPSSAGPVQKSRYERSKPDAPRGANLITPSLLESYLTFLASDELEGRDTPSRGLDTAARFLAFQLTRLGLRPAGDDGYYQRIAMTRRRVEPARTHAVLKGQTFAFGDHFLASATPGSAEGPLVYVSHGYVVTAKNIDAYKGVNVSGKILVAHAGLPDGITRADVRGRPGRGWENPQSYAARHGALGVVFIPDFRALSEWDRVRARALRRGSIIVDKLQAEDTPARVPTITASPAVVSALFRGEKLTAAHVFKNAQNAAAADPVELDADKILSFSVVTIDEKITTQNVVAILDGTDPALRNEFVALGAHYDHMGLADEGADRIFNGADDDGSGTTALVAIAEAAVRSNARPQRSLLFVWHAGEESGLLGSRYLTMFPPVELDRIIAQLNVDMIGRSRKPGDTGNPSLTGPNELYVIGSKMMSTELGVLSERVNRGFLNLSFNYKYDDPNDPERFFFRSDHYSYARKGIPIIFYFTGVHEDYHQVSDDVKAIDFDKMARITQTIYATALALADAPTRPRVDKPLAKELTEPQ